MSRNERGCVAPQACREAVPETANQIIGVETCPDRGQEPEFYVSVHYSFA